MFRIELRACKELYDISYSRICMVFVVKGVIKFQCAFVIKLYGLCELNMNKVRVY